MSHADDALFIGDEKATPGVDIDPLCSLGLYAGRVRGQVVGRPSELAAAEQELNLAQKGLACLALEGEPGIGKTRLLIAIQELARSRGFTTIAVTADEEIRGPFLLARSIFASQPAQNLVPGSPAEVAMRRVTDAISNRDEPGLEGLTPDRKMLRIFDLAAVALRALGAEQPLAILVDDLQWADEDSLRMIRYIVRVDAASPIFLALALRSEETSLVREAVTLLADIERLGFLRRLRLSRFTQFESMEFLQGVLGGPVNPASAAVMHAQAEGVPFILAEQAQAYRDAGLIQQIDSVWTLARHAERLVPSAVRTLIQRRAARLPEETRTCLADAAPLGRSFSLRDLRNINMRLDGRDSETWSLAEALAPAVRAGLLIQHTEGWTADYTFAHDQIREYASAGLTPPRRRAIHATLVDMILSAGQPSPEYLPLLAQHALAAGQHELCVRMAAEAASEALKAHAPDEVLRLVEMALPVASAPRDRIALLRLQDDAFGMLRRASQRLEGLAELAALADALGDSHLELDVMLRRAAALRLSREHEAAADLARRVRQMAADHGDALAELAACLELGQSLLGVELGEGYVQAPSEADLDGAAEAYQCAVGLAETLNDEVNLAAASRELGVIAVSRIRIWFIGMFEAGEYPEILRRVAAGERIEDMLPSFDIAPVADEAAAQFRRALDIYERLGDRRGAISTIISMAFVTWAPEIHIGGSAKRIEELHRLMSKLKGFTKESERALAEAQMLFGAHVYSRMKLFPDMALTKGEEAYVAARTLGDRSLEFASAGGMALVHADLGQLEEAKRWLDRAAAIASTEPTPLRARELEIWHGIVSAAAKDAPEMVRHLERAVQIATEQGRPAARCEALAQLASEAARLSIENHDEELLVVAQRAAQEAIDLAPALPGHTLFGAQAYAAMARVHLGRGRMEAAAEAAREGLKSFEAAMVEDVRLDILLPASEALLAAGTDEEGTAIRGRLRVILALIAQHILNEDVRARWFRSRDGRALTSLAGRLDGALNTPGPTTQTGLVLTDVETGLLRLVTEGHTNREIAESLGTTEDLLARQLLEVFAKIGASSRSEATATALMGKLV